MRSHARGCERYSSWSPKSPKLRLTLEAVGDLPSLSDRSSNRSALTSPSRLERVGVTWNRDLDSRIGAFWIQRAGWRRSAWMGKPYSQDLRDRGIDAVERDGMSRREAAKRFGVSDWAAIKWLQRVRDRGIRTAFAMGGNRCSVLAAHRDVLEAALAEKPDRTLQALCDLLLAERAVKADTSMMSRFLRRAGITFKKRRCRARAGPPRHRPSPRPLAPIPGAD